MSLILLLVAAALGGLGAGVRYLVDVAVAQVAGARFPWGVMLVNLTGSFALGVIVGALPGAAFVLGAGFLGGYTTFSTTMLDTVALWRDGERAASVANAMGMLLAGVLLAAAGLAIGAAL
ncbi:CrcB family protein [Microbacterium sp.]|uniref:fluoride efflux transporter FluC n=1 Tax=Microbacterium sp. TaxID=51671 RepID=UPI002810A466|nr:CrcB family protein [Microbacterium sp.]